MERDDVENIRFKKGGNKVTVKMQVGFKERVECLAYEEQSRVLWGRKRPDHGDGVTRGEGCRWVECALQALQRVGAGVGCRDSWRTLPRCGICRTGAWQTNSSSDELMHDFRVRK